MEVRVGGFLAFGIGGAIEVRVQAHHFGPFTEFEAEGEVRVRFEDGGVKVVRAFEGLVDVAIEDAAADY